MHLGEEVTYYGLFRFKADGGGEEEEAAVEIMIELRI